MKKVIFVGGTEFSGSSFFHMILANDPHGFSCGEASSFCRPYRPQHTELKCGCGEDGCTIWQEVAAHGTGNLYQTLFEQFPEVQLIVDSSKGPFWIQAQNRALAQLGIQAENILIWKTPLEYAFSCQRRGRLDNWEERWVNYHRLYASVIDEWRAVQYRTLVNEARTLEAACHYLGIPYFPGKERYWERVHHVLFVNFAARMHLYSADRAQDFVANTTNREKMRFHRTIYYEDIGDQELASAVQKAVAASDRFDRVFDLLEAYDVGREQMDSAAWQRAKFSGSAVALRKARYLARNQVGRLRYGQRAC